MGMGALGRPTTTLRTGGSPDPLLVLRCRLFRAARSASTSITRNSLRHFSRNSSTTATTPLTALDSCRRVWRRRRTGNSYLGTACCADVPGRHRLAVRPQPAIRSGRLAARRRRHCRGCCRGNFHLWGVKLSCLMCTGAGRFDVHVASFDTAAFNGAFGSRSRTSTPGVPSASAQLSQHAPHRCPCRVRARSPGSSLSSRCGRAPLISGLPGTPAACLNFTGGACRRPTAPEGETKPNG